MVRTAPVSRCSRSNFPAGVAFSRRRVDFAGKRMNERDVSDGRTRTWPSETVRIWYRALHARRGRRRATESGFGRFAHRFVGINIIFYKMEFIYDIRVVGAAVLVWNNFLELEVLKAGGEEGRMGRRVEVVVGHGVEDERGRAGSF